MLKTYYLTLNWVCSRAPLFTYKNKFRTCTDSLAMLGTELLNNM